MDTTRAYWSWATIVASATVVAIVVALGPVHRLDNADSLVPVLLSLYHWTPFFWLQNRFGMLVPLLAIPIKSPFWNFIFQSWLDGLCGALAFFLVPACLVARRRAFLAGTFAVLTIAGSPLKLGYELFGPAQPYSVSMLLLAVSLFFATDRELPPHIRKWLSIAALLGAIWVNVAITILALLLGAALLAAKPEKRRDTVRWLGSVLVLGVIYWGVTRFAPYGGSTSLNPELPGQWVHGWRELGLNSWTAFLGPAHWVLAGCGLLGLVVSVARRERSATAAPVLLIVAGLGYFGVIGTLKWLAENDFAARYAVPALMLALSGMSVAAADLVERFVGTATDRIVVIGAAIAMVGAAVTSCGFPDASRTRAILAERMGALSEDVVASGCDGVVGDYWTVWPAVFHTNLVLHEQANRRLPVWAATFRADPWLRSGILQHGQTVRIALPIGDASVPSALEHFHLRLIGAANRLRTIDVVEAQYEGP